MENFDDFKPIAKENFDDFAPVAKSTDRATETPNTLGRQIGLTGRALGNVITSPIQMTGNFLNKSLNKINGVMGGDPNYWQLPSEVISRQLDKVTPIPNNGVERFTQEIAKSAPAFALPAALPYQITGNAAASYALSPQGDELSNTILGAAVPAVIGGVTNGLPKSKAAKVLLDKDVSLTPGQAVDRGTITGKVAHGAEQIAGSNPISAPFVRNAQQRGLNEANIAATQSVANHIDHNIKLGSSPREAIQKTHDLISEAYTNSLSGIKIPKASLPDENLVRSIASTSPMMDDAQIAQMVRYANNRISSFADKNNGVLTGEMAKQLDSEIGQHIRNLSTSSTAADRTAASSWRDLQAHMRELMAVSQPDPAKSQLLSNANTAYRQLLAVEKALLNGADNFTPRQLARTLDKANIKGTELNTISDAMKQTLPNTLPNSGTTERLIGAMLPSALIGGGYGADQLGYPTIGSGMVLAGALGSKTGTKALLGSTAAQRLMQPITPQLTAATLAALRAKNAK